MLGRLLRNWWRNAFSAAPGRAHAAEILDRARRARSAGEFHRASLVLEEGVRELPEEPELWNELGVLGLARNDFAAAEPHFRRALALRPDLAEAHCNLAIAQAEQGRVEQGVRSFQRAIELAPELLAAHENFARLLTRHGQDTGALAAWEEVLRLQPEHAEAHLALGVLQMRAGRFGDARASFARSRRLGTEAPSLSLYEALIEAADGDDAGALRSMASLRGQVEDADLDWNRALVHLSRGEFAEGWPLYEARLRKSFESPRRAYPFPEWTGAALQRGALLVMGEQGLGDEIMFASCYADALERAPDCVIECDPRLRGLFARSFPGAAVVGVPRDNDRGWLREHPRLRCQIHAGSLPRLFRAGRDRFPEHNGYLRADPQRLASWRASLSSLGAGMKVGIAWNGGLVHTRRALRCVPLPELAPLLRGSENTFVSLQHDDDGSEAARLAEMSGTQVHVFAEALRDLDEMAALLSALDLVITVCSSVVHLSGALGTRTWVLAPRVPEWRYLRAGAELPWYPRVRMLRQGGDRAWQPVVLQAATLLSTVAPRD